MGESRTRVEAAVGSSGVSGESGLSLQLDNSEIVDTQGILVREETKFLENKANSVFDNIMRVFILELSFMKSIEFDVNNILRKIKD